jgi:hypothetical protein
VGVSAYAAYEYGRRFEDCGGAHDFFPEVRATFSVFYGEDVGHARLVTCKA